MSSQDRTSAPEKRLKGLYHPHPNPPKIPWTCQDPYKSYLDVCLRPLSRTRLTRCSLSWRNRLLQLKHSPLRDIQSGDEEGDVARVHGRDIWRGNQSSQCPPARAQLDERGQVQKHTSRGASKGYVGETDTHARGVGGVKHRVFSDRLTSGITLGSEYQHTERCPYSAYARRTYVACNGIIALVIHVPSRMKKTYPCGPSPA